MSQHWTSSTPSPPIRWAARLRGAQTVVVGIQPSVAIAMATWGLALEPAHTALDLEEGTALLDGLVGR
jgi:rsbT antagonist protein RsbS